MFSGSSSTKPTVIKTASTATTMTSSGLNRFAEFFSLMIFMHGFIFYVNMVTFTIVNTNLIISNREEADNMGKGLKDSVSRILGTTHSLEQVRSLSLF